MMFLTRIPIAVMAGIWLVAVALGFVTLERYTITPASSGAAHLYSPTDSKLGIDSRKPTMIVFLHPLCPCSRATMHVVLELLSKTPAMKVYTIFVRPENVGENWEKRDLYQESMRDKRITTMVDDKGAEAAKFGAKTSGQIYVYGPDKRLRFSGGVTSGRGMIDSCWEKKAIEQALDAPLSKPNQTPVYGCELL